MGSWMVCAPHPLNGKGVLTPGPSPCATFGRLGRGGNGGRRGVRPTPRALPVAIHLPPLRGGRRRQRHLTPRPPSPSLRRFASLRSGGGGTATATASSPPAPLPARPSVVWGEGGTADGTYPPTPSPRGRGRKATADGRDGGAARLLARPAPHCRFRAGRTDADGRDARPHAAITCCPPATAPSRPLLSRCRRRRRRRPSRGGVPCSRSSAPRRSCRCTAPCPATGCP